MWKRRPTHTHTHSQYTHNSHTHAHLNTNSLTHSQSNLHTHTQVCEKTVAKLLDLLDQNSVLIQVEMATTLDAMKPFVKATYTNEGDGGNLPFDTWDRVQELFQHIRNFRDGLHPNLTDYVNARFTSAGQDVMTAEQGTPQHTKQFSLLFFVAANARLLLDIGERAAETAFKWFELKMEEAQIASQLEMWKTARYCDPRKVASLAQVLFCFLFTCF